MKKKRIFLEAPVFSRSGYGQLSDDIAQCLISNKNYDVTIAKVPWGHCAERAIKTKEDEKITERLLAGKEVVKPDVFIACNLPANVPQRIGKKNMVITAGIEVIPCHMNQIKGLNNFDLGVTLSTFSKAVFEVSGKDELKTPIKTLPWSTDTSIYKQSDVRIPSVDKLFEPIKEKEAFLFVGQRTHPDIESDRKNIAELVRTFCYTFFMKSDAPALILKSHATSYSIQDKDDLYAEIKKVKETLHLNDLPSIYIFHGELSKPEMNALYNHPKIIGHISLTHGEGWGGPLLEASLSGKPVFAPKWSGIIDFLPSDKAVLFDGKLNMVPASMTNNSQFFPDQSVWFNCESTDVSKRMKDYVYGDRTPYMINAKELAKINAEKFNMNQMSYRLNKLIEKI